MAALGIHDRRQQLLGLGEVERAQLDPLHIALAGREVGPGQPRRRLSVPEGEREKHRRARTPTQKMGEQLERRLVGPVHVVERENHGPSGGEQLEQCADGCER